LPLLKFQPSYIFMWLRTTCVVTLVSGFILWNILLLCGTKDKNPNQWAYIQEGKTKYFTGKLFAGP